MITVERTAESDERSGEGENNVNEVCDMSIDLLFVSIQIGDVAEGRHTTIPGGSLDFRVNTSIQKFAIFAITCDSGLTRTTAQCLIFA